MRKSGILAHPTSFPSKYGIGDLGKGAYEFVDFLEKSGQKLCQILPLGQTSFGDSPYQSFSAFAGNIYIISPDIFVKKGYLSKKDIEIVPEFDEKNVEYGKVINYKMSLFRTAFKKFKENKEYLDFCDKNAFWLEVELNAIKDCFYGGAWNSFPEDIRDRKPKAVEKYKKIIVVSSHDQKYLERKYKKANFYTVTNGVVLPSEDCIKEKQFGYTLGILHYWGCGALIEIDWFVKSYLPKLRLKYPQLKVI